MGHEGLSTAGVHATSEKARTCDNCPKTLGALRIKIQIAGGGEAQFCSSKCRDEYLHHLVN